MYEGNKTRLRQLGQTWSLLMLLKQHGCLQRHHHSAGCVEVQEHQEQLKVNKHTELKSPQSCVATGNIGNTAGCLATELLRPRAEILLYADDTIDFLVVKIWTHVYIIIYVRTIYIIYCMILDIR